MNSAIIYKTVILRELEGYRDYDPVEDYKLSVRISNHYELSNFDEVLFSILMCDHAPDNLNAYLELFIKLKAANIKLKIYPIAQFEKMLFDNWFRAIHEKKTKGAIGLLFNKDLFK